ncbi:hypothetical protein Mapa_016595 [Marchantia paleacea]|nr:hypothetical protein Mapa_016595 [Marchantia paleacea]
MFLVQPPLLLIHKLYCRAFATMYGGSALESINQNNSSRYVLKVFAAVKAYGTGRKEVKQGGRETQTEQKDRRRSVEEENGFRISDCALTQSYKDRRRQGDRPRETFYACDEEGRDEDQRRNGQRTAARAFFLGLAQTWSSVGSFCLSLAPQPSELASSKTPSCEVSRDEEREAGEERQCDTAEL